VIYVYAIVDRPETPLPGQLGLHDEALTAVVWRDVAAVVSTFDAAQLARTADELWRHENVVEALMSNRAVLPARFGTMLPSRQQIGDILRSFYRTLVQDIERVRGHVEIGMRFLSNIEESAELEQPPAASNRFIARGAGPGSAYLLARLARKQQLQDRQRAKLGLVRDVYDLLARHANASWLDREWNDRRGISAAFLVPRDRIGSFRDVVGEVAGANRGVALLCTGPWPPYSFVRTGAGGTDWSKRRHAS